MTPRRTLACAAALALGAASAGVRADTAVPATGAAGRAVATPLQDVNVVRSKIPPVLLSALNAPYATPTDRGCDALGAEVRALDVALGADLDAPPATAPGAVESGAGDLLRGAAEGVIPFRSWVRKLSGAERNAREVASAVAAGTVRRAYLKGLGQASGCAAPAAPAAASAASASAAGASAPSRGARP
jgi:hypothetical protein